MLKPGKQSGIFIPHPFAPFHFFCPPENILKMADRIDAVEIRNGRNFRILNAYADMFCSLSKIQGYADRTLTFRGM